ncbi:MAG TPA: tyrosine-type recombinase/integrase [Candidatus Acidoferrales bacterium]|nr:tyrosine-type recombinase/integrase [Candidatus Acidoferrales bacterium]
MIHKLGIALSEGPESSLWTELCVLLPPMTFARFADFTGVRRRQHPTWKQLKESYETFKRQRIKIGKLEESTLERYQYTLREFELFLAEKKLLFLRDIRVPEIEDFKVWRFDRIMKHKHCRDGAGLALDVSILHGVFAFALKREMMLRNPVITEGTPGDNPQRGAEPFNSEQLVRLREHAGKDMLSFLTLRWTGFRGSDAVRVTWLEIDLLAKEVTRLTKKRKKWVKIPLHTELLFALGVERDDRQMPNPNDPVLLNPDTGKPLTRPGLYRRMVALGRRAGVPSCHPHRFRDTFAVDLLLKGASPYDVAKLLGDTIETVEKHYMPFVKELRERVRGILETGVGLEKLARQPSEEPQNASKKPN